MSQDTEEYKGYTINIDYDEDPMNPRIDCDNAAVMVCWHRRYNLGDLQNSRPISNKYEESIDLLYELAGVDRNEYQEQEHEKTGTWDDMTRDQLFKLIEEKGTIISSLYLYDHSGITISMGSFGCPWDSGQIGYIYMTKESIEKEGWTPEQAMKYMEGEVEVYDNYLTGEVYRFEIEDSDGNEIESCSGWYGDDGKEDMIKECKSIIDHQAEKKHKRDLLLGIQIELALWAQKQKQKE